MTYERFEDVPVWKASARLYVDLQVLAATGASRDRGDLESQLLRAALSISNNIAEGFERGTTNELIAFLYYAKGSAGEARSMLTIMMAMRSEPDLKSQISDLKSQAESISRQLNGWLRSLQNSDIKGPRHLDDAERARYDRKRRAEAFLKELEQIRRRADRADEDG